ncbi:hypothetical protein HELRODRAFT_164181 [Helobdella robusta]|uniref:Uncharacterized protein n=1 Tax=Helobdella robusta TaxID=6412 RepID=T1EV20_HELRO|nr:hypothetical protein HELRODRAFT_164181 [Helobdella robusta]ESN94352.1 hypothetical protein HELRODRAFT_164181 [Helobdella robusta]
MFVKVGITLGVGRSHKVIKKLKYIYSKIKTIADSEGEVDGQKVDEVGDQEVGEVGGQVVDKIGGQGVDKVGGQEVDKMVGNVGGQVGNQVVDEVGSHIVGEAGVQEVNEVGGQMVDIVDSLMVSKVGGQVVDVIINVTVNGETYHSSNGLHSGHINSDTKKKIRDLTNTNKTPKAIYRSLLKETPPEEIESGKLSSSFATYF